MPVRVNEVRGLKEFRAALRELPGSWQRELREINRRISDQAAGWARAEAAGGSPMQRAAAGAIVGAGTASVAAVAVAPGPGDGFANAAFWGAKRHSGWYVQEQYRNGPPQFPPWVGAGWEPAALGQGPYAINPALARHKDELIDQWGDAFEQLTHEAFPD